MKRLAFLSLVTLLFAGGCDRSKDRLPTSPRPSLSKSASARSSVCASYQRQLTAAEQQLTRAPNDPAAKTRAEALRHIVADACN
jgi:hypothetical protein